MLGYLVFVVLAVGCLYAAYHFWHKKIEAELAEGGQFEYERLAKADPELIEGVSEQDFKEIFNRVEMPRRPGYMVAVISAFLIGSPIMMAMLSFGDWAMHRFGVIPQPNEVVSTLLLDEDGQARLIKEVPPEALQYYVQDLGGFYYFFGMLAFWVLIVWWFMRRFYQRKPGLLRDEILRAR